MAHPQSKEGKKQLPVAVLAHQIGNEATGNLLEEVIHLIVGLLQSAGNVGGLAQVNLLFRLLHDSGNF
jgi:hypothetical protein